MTTPRAKQQQRTKDRRYRATVKARALAIKGARCERCGFDDARALRMHHTKPIRRGRSGLPKKAMSSTASHLAVVRGDKGLPSRRVQPLYAVWIWDGASLSIRLPPSGGVK